MSYAPEYYTDGLLADIVTELSAIRKLAESDIISFTSAGSYYERRLERGTATQLIPDKKIKQTDGVTDLTNPMTQRYGGAVEE